MAYAIAAVIVLILDQASKYLTTLDIPLGGSVPLIPGVIELTNVQNTGAAFGLLNDLELARWLFVGLTLVLCVVIIILLAKKVVKGCFGRWMLVLIMAGGLGNCIDRVINGYVTDMFNLQFISFPVFNVADIFISVCGVMFIIYLIVSIFTGGERRVKEGFDEELEEPRPARKRSQAGDYEEKQAQRQDYIAQLQQTAPAKPAAKPPLGEVRSWDELEAEPPAKKPEAPVEKPTAETPAPEPAPAPAPAAKPAAKADSGDYKLEDILAEFSDK